MTAVLIQRQTGGDLSEVLGNISNVDPPAHATMPERRRQDRRRPIDRIHPVAFPVIMFGICYYLNPELYGGFAKNETGKNSWARPPAWC